MVTNLSQWAEPAGNGAKGHAMLRLLDADGDGTDDVLFHPGWTGAPNPKLFTSRVLGAPPFNGPFSLLGYVSFVNNNGGVFPMSEPLTRVIGRQ